MIYGLDHKPIPNSEIVRRLKQIDPRLGLVMSETVNQQTQRIEPAWGITLDWLPTDMRHRMVQAGELPLDATFDVIDHLPFDCGPDEAYGYIVRSFKAWAGTRDDIKGYLERVHTFNRKAQDEAIRQEMEGAEELLQANAATLFAEQGKTSVTVGQVTHRPRESREQQERRLREHLGL